MLKLVSLFVVVMCGVSHADDLSVQAKTPQQNPGVAVTFSPLHLLIAMVEGQAEIRVAPKVGVAVIGGIGSLRVAGLADRVTMIEAGAQARYYVTGSFRSGLEVGVEALYAYAKTNEQNIDIKAAGLALSPFAGYKWTLASGLTIEAQGGASYMAVQGHASTGQMSARSAWGPLLNLQMGYSF